MLHKTWFRVLATTLLDDAIVTESSDEETADEPMPSTRSPEQKLPGTRPLDTEELSSTRPPDTETLPSTRTSNAEEMPNIREGVITRSRAKELARKAHTMIKEEKFGEADTRSYFNIFTTAT
ncbi:unnamed protein product [Cochlearia groenlandica]